MRYGLEMAEDRIVSNTSVRGRALVDLIHSGNVEGLAAALAEDPSLARTRVDDGQAVRSTLHLVTDWPGRRPAAARMIALLVQAGSDPNARCVGPHTETPLHWAASCNDVPAIDALVAAGANLEADGAVIGGLSPMADAVAFGQWAAARRLMEHGAHVNFWQGAGLGIIEILEAGIAEQTPEAITRAFWSACHGGHHRAAEFLLEHGADPTWVGYDGLTPRAIAAREEHDSLVSWLDSVVTALP